MGDSHFDYSKSFNKSRELLCIGKGEAGCKEKEVRESRTNALDS